jgi:Fic family protein
MYLWEQEDWPNFNVDHESLSKPLADLARQQGALLARVDALGFEMQDELHLKFATEDIMKSSEIEGEMLPEDQVRSSIARSWNYDMAGLVNSAQEVDGVVAMMLDATENFNQPMTEDRLLEWNTGLFPEGKSGMLEVQTGSYRDDVKGPMQVVSGPIGRQRVHFEALPANRVPEEMARFLDWFNSNQAVEPLLGAGLAHLWFLTIHPFDDGNGRVARALTDMLLARADGRSKRCYSIYSQVMAERNDYYGHLERAQKRSMDATIWMLWFFEMLSRAMQNSEDVIGAVGAKSEWWKKHGSTIMNDRQRQVVNLLLGSFEGKLSSSKYAKLTKVSQDTASRDLNDLLEKGLMVKIGGGRSTRFWLEGRVPEDG